MIRYLPFLIFLFVNIAVFLSMKKDSTYRSGKLFLVTIPESEMNCPEVADILAEFKKMYRLSFIIALLSVCTVLFYRGMWGLLFIPQVFLNIFIMVYPLRRANQKLKNLKITKHWNISTGHMRQFDITIAAHMKQSMIRPIWFAIPTLMAVAALIIKGQYHVITYMYLGLLFVVPIAIYIFIYRLPNRTYCDDSTLNVTLNRNRRHSFSVALLLLLLGDTAMFLNLVFVLDESSDTLWLVLPLIVISAIFILSGMGVILHYQRKLKQILQYLKSPLIYDDEDDYWHYSMMGPVYNNPNDPEVFKDNGSDINTSLNMGRPSVKIFYCAVLGCVAILLIGLFGYPALLDSQNKLVDVSIGQHIVKIDSPLYGKEIPIASIKKVAFIKALPENTRVGGTDTGVYATGNYDSDRYGKMKMYVAYHHPAFIVAYTTDGIIIFNDDDVDNTKAIYQVLQAKCAEDK